jgi:mRNA interferase MazF
VALRGEIWFADLDPTRGREHQGTRPILIVSADPFNNGPAQLIVGIPMTTKDKRVPTHVRIDPPEAGLSETSFVITEAIRSLSKERLKNKKGMVTAATMRTVEDRLRVVLDL